MIIRTLGRKSIVSWNIRNVKKRNITPCKFWKRPSKHDGKRYRKNNAKVISLRRRSVRTTRIVASAIKQYIVSLVISHSQNPELMDREKVYLNKLDVILVQVTVASSSSSPLRFGFSFRFWNTNGRRNGRTLSATSSKRVKPANRCARTIWKFWNFSGSFDRLGRSKRCTPFPFFSEEVFDFSSGQMTQAKAKHLKDTMCNEFTKIFQLCEYVVVRTFSFFRFSFRFRISLRTGKIASSAVTFGHTRNTVTVSQLDSTRLHFRNEHGQHPDRDVFHRSDVSQRHSALSDGNR